MTTTYTFDVFSSLDGFGAASGNWSGYWGKQGPELLDHRLALYREQQRGRFHVVLRSAGSGRGWSGRGQRRVDGSGRPHRGRRRGDHDRSQ